MFDHLSVPPGLALIFDMDGVLLENTAVHTQAWEIYLERHGIPSEGVMQAMLGKRNDEIVEALWGSHLSKTEIDAHGFAKERLYRELIGPKLRLHQVAGSEAFLRALKALNVPTAVATNAEPLNVDFVLDGYGIRDCFRVVIDGHQVAKPKPDPEVYLTACQRLGVEPRNCVVFEDSPGGMRAALAAGTRLVAVLTTVSEAPQAALAIRDFLDPRLPEWLAAQPLR